MVNHVRTLLINLPSYGEINAYAPVGEEYIDPSFAPLDLSKDFVQSAVQKALFGAQPDRWMSNYRVHQLLNIMAQSSLERRVLDLDGRISYVLPSPAVTEFYCLPTRSGSAESLYRFQVVRNSADRDVLIMPAEQFLCPDTSGQVYYEGLLEHDGSSTAILRGVSRGRSRLVLNLTLDSSGQWYLPVEVRDLAVFLQLPAPGPSSWNIRLWRSPCWTALDLFESVDSLSDEIKHKIFYGVSYKELLPASLQSSRADLWNDYRDVWQRADSIIDRLSAFLLAVVLCRDAMLQGRK